MPLPDELADLARRVNNWGRWGDDDERGTINLITADVVRAAAACVRDGRTIPLALPLSMSGPQTGGIPGRSNPIRTMVSLNRPIPGDAAGVCFNDDVVFMGLQAATHWDALTHVSFEGRCYNGIPAGAVTAAGATRAGIDKAGPIVSRGVLLDVARTKGAERLEPGYAVTPDDLDAAEQAAGVRVGAGDIVLVRTGHVRLFHERNRDAYPMPCPGLGARCALWFHERDVAAVAIDTMAVEVLPPERPDCLFPLHVLHLIEMGLLQGQNFDLEALSEDCAADGRYAFLLSATPEPFARAVGAPVAPVAIK